jgi:hypothetical protein
MVCWHRADYTCQAVAEVASQGQPPWVLQVMVPVVAIWDCLAELAIVVETPLPAVSQQRATHSHPKRMASPRCWCGAAYDNCRSHATHSDHDAPCTPAGAYRLPHYNSI